MTGEQALQVLAYLLTAYDHVQVSEAKQSFYLAHFALLPFGPTMEAVVEAVGRSRYLPTIAEILEHVGQGCQRPVGDPCPRGVEEACDACEHYAPSAGAIARRVARSPLPAALKTALEGETLPALEAGRP